MSWNDKVLTLNEIIQVKQRRGYACFYSLFHLCPVKMGRVKQLIKKPRNQGII